MREEGKKKGKFKLKYKVKLNTRKNVCYVPTDSQIVSRSLHLGFFMVGSILMSSSVTAAILATWLAYLRAMVGPNQVPSLHRDCIRRRAGNKNGWTIINLTDGRNHTMFCWWRRLDGNLSSEMVTNRVPQETRNLMGL